MCSSREKAIAKLKLDTYMNRFVLAKSLFAVEKDVDEELLAALANTILNRFLYEMELDEMANLNIIKIITSSFNCWNNYKLMELIDTTSCKFRKCLNIAKLALSGQMQDSVNSSIGFHRDYEKPLWAVGLSKCMVVRGFYFYNNCA